jgi:hypothetical protein
MIKATGIKSKFTFEIIPMQILAIAYAQTA